MSTRARKTVEVAKVKEWANHYLAVTGAGNADERRGVATLLEQVLHDTNSYRGYRYLDGTDAVHSGDYDETRRQYH